MFPVCLRLHLQRKCSQGRGGHGVYSIKQPMEPSLSLRLWATTLSMINNSHLECDPGKDTGQQPPW